MNITQFISNFHVIIAQLYINIDSLKKKNNDLESLVLIQKEQIQKLNDDNEQLKTHNSKLIDDNNFFSSRYDTYFHLYYNLQEYNTLNKKSNNYTIYDYIIIYLSIFSLLVNLSFIFGLFDTSLNKN